MFFPFLGTVQGPEVSPGAKIYNTVPTYESGLVIKQQLSNTISFMIPAVKFFCIRKVISISRSSQTLSSVFGKMSTVPVALNRLNAPVISDRLKQFNIML